MEAYEWDVAKAASNLKKHGVDFQGAIRIFEGPIVESRSTRRDEERWKAIGLVDDLELAVVYTWRASRRRRPPPSASESIRGKAHWRECRSARPPARPFP